MVAKNREIYELQLALAERDALIEGLNAEVRSQRQELDAIKSSTVWKMTLPYRFCGSGVKYGFYGIKLLVRDPAFAGRKALRLLAGLVRRHASLRRLAHVVFRNLPQAWRTRLISIAPPSAAEVGIIAVAPAVLRPEFLGEAGWIYRRIKR